VLVGSCADPAIGKLVGWRTVAVQVAGARVEVTTAGETTAACGNVHA
jgi:hypothetical protein